MLNATYPLVGFAIENKKGEIDFVHEPSLSSGFSKFGRYSVLSEQVLVQRITDESVEDLSEAEIDQMSYWKPTRVGEVIFNHWD